MPWLTWGIGMRRREFLGILGGAVVWPGASESQQAERVRRVGLLNIVGPADPVSAGFVESMAHPGGNITGFSSFEYSMSGKWAELLKQIAPNMTRALVFRDPTSAAGIGQFAAVRSVAQSLGVELTPLNVRDT